MWDNQINFEVKERRALVVWVYSFKQLKALKRFGTILYVSRKMKYVILYLDEDNVEKAEVGLKKLHFVRNVEKSYRPDIEMNFGEKVGSKIEIDNDDDLFEVEEAKTKIKLAENI